MKPDNTAAAVQAATGQPLLAQSAPQNFVYMQQMVAQPQPQGYHPQMGQVRTFRTPDKVGFRGVQSSR